MEDGDEEFKENVYYTYANALIEAGAITKVMNHDLEYSQAFWYKESAKLLRRLKRDDVFAFLCLSHYGQQNAINPLLFKAEGNWHRFGQFIHLVKGFTEVWDKFFAYMLDHAPSVGAAFTDKSGKHVITTKADLLRYYPEMRRYLELKDKTLFMRLYASAIQSAILGIPKSPLTNMFGWRGYSPVDVQGSLSLDLMRYKTGERVTNWGLGSVSLHHTVSAGFANLDKACCMMYIHFPPNFPIMMLTSDKSDKKFPSIPTPWRQMEILLPAGTIFQIGANMGKLYYTPYNKPGDPPYAIETRAVFIIGIMRSKGHIRNAKRAKMMATTANIHACLTCGTTNVPLFLEHKNPLLPVYCGAPCQRIEAPALSIAFRSQPFYRTSAVVIDTLKHMDIFGYLCLSHYGLSPVVNKLMFALQGDWTKTEQMMQMIAITPEVWKSFFASVLAQAHSTHPMTDFSGAIAIRSLDQLLYYYPDMQKYLEMTDMALALRFYMSSLHSSITQTANIKGNVSLQAWRGYKPVTVANSLSLNPSNHKMGSVITNWGVTSISLQSNISAGFAALDQACCMMQLTVPADFPVFLLTSDDTDTQYPSLPTPFHEMEVLLPAGTQFKIGKRLGKKMYTRYTPANPNETIMLDTIKVRVVGTQRLKGYVGYRKRFEWSRK